MTQIWTENFWGSITILFVVGSIFHRELIFPVLDPSFDYDMSAHTLAGLWSCNSVDEGYDQETFSAIMEFCGGALSCWVLHTALGLFILIQVIFLNNNYIPPLPPDGIAFICCLGSWNMIEVCKFEIHNPMSKGCCHQWSNWYIPAL